MDEPARARFRARFREAFEGDPSKSTVYKDVSNGVAPAGIEYYLPLFFDATGQLFDYLPAGATLVLHHDVHGAIDQFWRDCTARFQLLRGDRDRPLLPPPTLFLTAEDFFVAAQRFARVDLHAPALARDDTDLVATLPVPEVAVERRAADPLHALKAFLETTPDRVLVLAESPGRRETMTEYFAQYGLAPAPCAGLDEFLGADARFMLGVGPLFGGFVAPAAALAPLGLAQPGFAIVTEAELYAGTARARAGREQAKRSSIEGMLRDLSELAVGDPVVHEQHGVGRYRGLVSLDLGVGADRVPAARIRRRRQAVRAGGAAPHHRPVLGRAAGAGAAAQARRRGLGKGEAPGGRAGARYRRGAPRALCPARRASRSGVRREAARSRGVRRGLRIRGDPRPDGGHRGGGARHARGQADGPPGVRRRRLRQDRGRAARRLRRRGRRPAGGGARADHAARRAAFQHLLRPLRRLAGAHRRAVALPHRQGDRRGAAGARRRPRRHRHRHPQAALARRQVPAARAGHRRRGAPLRRATEGAPESAARGGRRAHAHRDADPAHPRHVARGPARPVGDRHRAREAARDQDVRRALLGRDHPRGRAARAEARRPDLLPAQRSRFDRRAGGAPRRARPGGAHRGRARPDARARARAGDARVPAAALEPARCARRSSRPASTSRPRTRS